MEYASSSVTTNIESKSNFLSVGDSVIGNKPKQRNPVVKFTKIQEYHFDTKVKWNQNPRLRRVVSVEDSPPSARFTHMKRRIATISESEEFKLYPGKNQKKSSCRYTPEKAVQTSLPNTPKNTHSSVTLLLVKKTKNCKEAQPVPRPVTRPSNDSKMFKKMDRTDTVKSRKEITKVNSRVTNYLLHENSNRGSSKSSISKENDVFKITTSKSFRRNTNLNINVPLETKPYNKKTDRNGDFIYTNNRSTYVDVRVKAVKDGDKPSATSTPEKQVISIIKTFKRKEVGKEDSKKDVPTETSPVSKDAQIVEKPVQNLEIDKLSQLKMTSATPPNSPQNKLAAAGPIHKCDTGPPVQLDINTVNNIINTINMRHMKAKMIKEENLQTAKVIYNNVIDNVLNFHKDEVSDGKLDVSSESTSQLLLTYPYNLVSVYKSEILNCHSDNDLTGNNSSHISKSTLYLEETKKSKTHVNHTSLEKVSASILDIKPEKKTTCHADDTTELFERELNFINTFCASVLFLEKCFVANKSLRFDQFKHNECVNKRSYNAEQLDERDTLTLDEETNSVAMASKSLCLLNLLIQDEQRRARNLLFVLKMREDALKDFTKSQILWLENKKKQENTDIPTLKKKQRGALLKLQQECGEMQRMRKMLLTLSQKRKAALMKTKKSLEIKMSSDDVVEKILCSKKKVRKIPDRTNVPLKCFEIGSSGCEDSAPKDRIPEITPALELGITQDVSVPRIDNIVDKNCVVVDGNFLNIIFRDLKMPQIFTNGKQYEVNEEALRCVVNSSSTSKVLEINIADKSIEPNKTESKSSTPSTARSLVEELDNYYKNLVDDDHKYSLGEKEPESEESQDKQPQTVPLSEEVSEFFKTLQYLYESEENIANSDTLVNTNAVEVEPIVNDSLEKQNSEDDIFVSAKSSSELAAITQGDEECRTPASTSTADEDYKSLDSGQASVELSSADLSVADQEAETLRQQQLAIEQEIKELERQQLLVVREIPDKPPPPYTPPVDSRAPPAPPFPAHLTVDTVLRVLENPRRGESSDSFEAFISDYCDEVREKQVAQSGEPWDATEFLPKKLETDIETFAKGTTALLEDLLNFKPNNTKPTGSLLSDKSSTRRSDHIDDILFKEWILYEPEWTNFHLDETKVKNQIFTSIFQKVLSETVDEYKEKVLSVESKVAQ